MVMPSPESDPTQDPPHAQPQPRPATFAQVVGAVLWSFFGVRKGKHMPLDAVTIKPLQVIIVGVALAALIVVALLLLVQLVLRVAR